MLEIFNKLYGREANKIFVAEDGSHTFLGYVWVGEGSNMVTGEESRFHLRHVS